MLTANNSTVSLTVSPKGSIVEGQVISSQEWQESANDQSEIRLRLIDENRRTPRPGGFMSPNVAGLSLNEAIVQGGLDFKVAKTNLVTVNGYPVDDLVGLQRSDNGKVLSTVTPRYVPLQNEEAFGQLGLLAQTYKPYHASTIGGGIASMMVFSAPNFPVMPPKKTGGPGSSVGDIVAMYFLAKNDNSGKGSSKLLVVSVRLKCTNGLTTTDNSYSSFFRHTSKIKNLYAEQVAILQDATKLQTMYQELLSKFGGSYIAKTSAEAQRMAFDVFEKLYKLPAVRGKNSIGYSSITGVMTNDDTNTAQQQEYRHMRIMALRQLAKDEYQRFIDEQPDFDGTAWPIIQAVTAMSYATGTPGKHQGLVQGLLGSGIQINQAVQGEALKLINIYAHTH